MPRHNQHCFTINNFTHDDVERLRNLGAEGEIRYLIFGRETGTSGTPHLQGYIRWKKQIAFSLAKVQISPRAHLEKANGSPLQNKEYCSKEGDFEEFGEIPKPKDRSSSGLREITNGLRDGRSLCDMAGANPEAYIRNYRGISAWMDIIGIQKDRDFKTEVYVFVGDPGIGKSKRAFEEAQNRGSVFFKQNGAWWDGYEGQDSIIMDDFYGSLPAHELLQLLDRYPMRLPVKGGFRKMISKTVYITSNARADKWYRDGVIDMRALHRRFTAYFEMFTYQPDIEPWRILGYEINC